MLKTSLLALMGGLALASLAEAQSFSYPDFTNWTGISPVGLTYQAGAILRLQTNLAPANGGDNRGAAWYDTAVNVVGGFDTTFEYQMHTPSTTGGSDGMAFVIHNDLIACSAPIVNGSPDGIGNMAIGRHASAAGFGAFTNPVAGDSVDNSVAIHFDTYNNVSWGDTNKNHISVHTGGSVDNSQGEDYSLGRVSPSTDLNDGNPHTVRVLYAPGTLEIYLDGVLELTVAYDFTTGGTWADSGTAVGGLTLVGGTSAYVGFTSGAGSAREFRDVLSWEFVGGLGGPGTGYCFGDPGSGTPCPCGNDNDGSVVGSGCANGVFVSGARIFGSGVASVGADTLLLTTTGLEPNNAGLYFQADNDLSPGQIWGDGLQCAGGSLKRLGVRFADGTGYSDTTGYPQPISVKAGNVNAGDTKHYQCWYRNIVSSPCGSNFNASNGYAVTWTP